METLSGTVHRIIWASPDKDNNFKIFLLKKKNGQYDTISGDFQEIVEGVSVEVHGDYKDHPKYGKGFRAKAHTFTYDKTSQVSIALYLQSIAKFVGPVKAHAIAFHFGEELEDVIENHPERLCEVENVGEKIAQNIVKAWNDHREEKSVRIFLHSLGLSENNIKKILLFFGIDAETKIRENPYLLCFTGFGFTTCDFIAGKLGFKSDDPLRYTHFVLWVLKEALNSGHLFLYDHQILKAINAYNQNTTFKFKNTDIILDDIASHLIYLEKEGYLVKNEDKYYELNLFFYENESARILSLIANKPDKCKFESIDIEKFIENYELSQQDPSKSYEFKLSNAQRDAIRSFIKEKILVVTGNPGTGKTTVLKAFVQLMIQNKVSFELLTPTGIASKKLGVTVGYEAYTIHRKLGYKGNSWDYNINNKYDTSVAIVDECCLPYKQFINLADGTKEYIGTIVNQKKHLKILSYNKITHKIESKEIIGWFKYPRKDIIYKIKVSPAKNRERQRTLRCTGKHKVYTENGQELASKINIGDKIVVKGKFLNKFQKSFIMGSLLGDSNIGGHPSGRILNFVHGQPQKDYLFLKADIFNCSKPYLNKGGYKPEKEVWHCSTAVIDDLDDIYKMIYPKGKKKVTKKWLEQIDTIGLAAWYMDDGHLSKQKSTRSINFTYTALLHTEGFSFKECKIITFWLKKKWGIKASVYKNGKRNHFFIRITADSSKIFWELITPWITPYFSYKIPNSFIPKGSFVIEPYIDISTYEVQSIKTYIPKDNYKNFVYDIQVKDNHNYFSNNVLVSNSMVDQEVFYRLVSALYTHTKLVFVGDNDQLPSVGPGRVLNELIQSGVIKTILLKDIFRQEEQSDIIKEAKKIRDGDIDLSLFKSDSKADIWFVRSQNIKELERTIIKLAKDLKDKIKKDNLKKTFQIITPRNSGPLSVDTLNIALQESLNPKKEGDREIHIGLGVIRVGDRVLIRKNDYQLGVFNGDIGKVKRFLASNIIVEIDDYEGIKEVEIPIEAAEELLKLAYVITVHKSQGMEYDLVILPFIKFHGKRILQRNLLYTAITRARKKVIVFGQGSALVDAIENDKIQERNTLFAQRIKEWMRNEGTSLRQLYNNPSTYQNAETLKQLLLFEERAASESDSTSPSFQEKLKKLENPENIKKRTQSLTPSDVESLDHILMMMDKKFEDLEKQNQLPF